MARYEFGGGAADFVTAPITLDRLFRATSASLTMWTAKTGGAQVSDLVLAGAPVATIPVGTNGQIPAFQGPDGVTTLWASANGGDRTRLLSPTAVEQAATAGVTSAAAVASAVSNDAPTKTALAAQTESRTATLSPVSYGYGDGTTSDYAALNAAATRAANFGLAVALGKATYNIGTSVLVLADGARLVGEGATITGSASANAVVSVGSDNVVQGVRVVNTASSGNIGINWRAGSKRTKVIGTRFVGSSNTQACNLSAAGIEDVWISGCTFDGVNYGVLSNGMGAGGADDISNVRITDNTFVRIYGDAIELNHPGDAVGDATRTTARGFTVTGNTISIPAGLGSGTAAGLGIGIAGVADATVTGNCILEARTAGIHIEDQAYRVTVTGNSVSNSPAPIRVLPSCRNVTIASNTVETSAGTGIDVTYSAVTLHSSAISVVGNTVRQVAIGIIVSGDAAYSGGGVVVTGNVVSDTTGDGISVRGPLDDVRVEGNVVTRAGGWGISADRSFARLRVVKDNTVTHCTLGDYKAGALTNGILPSILHDRTAHIGPSASAASDGFVTASLFRMGIKSQGTLVLEAYKADGFLCQYVCSFTWDGTVFDTTTINTGGYGSVGVGPLSVVNGVLTWRIYATTQGVILASISARFNGLMVEDGTTPSGTVAAT